MTVFKWLNGASGPWDTLGNWYDGVVQTLVSPAEGDTAAIFAGTVSVGAAVVVSGLRMTGSDSAPSVLAGPAKITATGSAVFGGTVVQTGPGTTQLNGSAQIGGPGNPTTLYLDGGRVLQNAGTMSLSNGTIDLGALPSGTPDGGGILGNAHNGTILIGGSGTVIAGGAGNTAVLNTGTIAVQASGDATISTFVQNGGLLTVQSGTLTLARGGTSTGAGTKVDAGATLELSSGEFTVQTATFAPAGTVVADGAKVNLSGVLLTAPLATLIQSSGTVLLGSHPTTIGTLEQVASSPAGSLLTTSATVNVDRQAVFSGTVVETGKGVTILNGSATLAASDAGATSLNLDQGRKLQNLGSLSIDSGAIALGSNPLGTTVGGGSLINGTAGLIDITVPGTVVVAGLKAGTFTNSGTVLGDAAGNAVLGVSVTNRGTIHVRTGTLTLNAGGVSRAPNVLVDAGAAFGIGGGTFSVSVGTFVVGGGLNVTGGLLDASHAVATDVAGTVQLSGGSIALGVRPATFGGFVQSGSAATAGHYSVLGGTALVTVTGDAAFSGVAVEKSSGTTKLQGTTTLQAGASLYLDGGRTVYTTGTFVANGGTVYLGAEASGTVAGDGHFTNTGTMDIRADGTVIAGVQGNATASNFGLLEKTAGTGTSAITANFVNMSTVALDTGTLAFAGTVGGTGVFAIGSNTVLDIGYIVSSGTMSFTGSGARLQIGDSADFSATVSTIGDGNQIDLTDFAWDATAIANFATVSAGGGNLTVTGAAGTVAIGFGTNLSSYTFTLGSDGHGGILIS